MTSVCFIGDRNIYLKRICNYLAVENFSVQLICRHDHGIDAHEFDPSITLYTLASGRLVKKIPAIRRIIQEIKPDYIHFQYLTKDILLALLVHHRINIIATPWGSDLNVFTRNIFNRIVMNLGLLFCDKIQMISGGMTMKIMQQFRFISRKKLHEISWGIDYQLFHYADEKKMEYWRERLKLDGSSVVILNYRNHRPLYNHHTLIRSLPGVIDRIPSVKCIFTRGNCDREYLESSRQLVQQLNLDEHVVFLDEWIPDDLLPALINLAHIVVSIPLCDGLPATVLEIMATHAIPVVGDLPEYASFFEEGVNGRVLKRLRDHEELTGLLLDCIDNLTAYRTLYSKNNNDYVREHQNWDLQKIRMKELYSG